MASHSGHRIASLLTGAWLLVSFAPANAGDAGAGGATGEEAAPSDTPSEEAAPTEDADEEAAPEATEVREAEPREVEPREDVATEVQQPPLHAVPPAELGRDPEEGPPRGDFLRRLRTTAEGIERGKASEPTQVHTDGDVTVLSNVAPSAASAEPATTQGSEAAKTSASSEIPSEASPQIIPVSVAGTLREPSSRADATQDSAPWHWLWILAGVATVLLLPIALLLTRATRSS